MRTSRFIIFLLVFASSLNAYNQNCSCKTYIDSATKHKGIDNDSALFYAEKAVSICDSLNSSFDCRLEASMVLAEAYKYQGMYTDAINLVLEMATIAETHDEQLAAISKYI
jgi:hypothetical protein